MDKWEGRLKNIEEALERMNARLSIQEAKAAIAGVMARYAFYVAAGEGRRIVDELWTTDDGASLEYGASGIYENLWRIKTYYIKDKLPGRLTTLSLSSPLLDVAPDLRSARGLWTAFCTESDAGDLSPAPPDKSDGRRPLLTSVTEDGQCYRAEILLQRYDVSFVLENGQWRISHLHVGEYFRCPFSRDWVLFAKERFLNDGMWLESLFESPEPLPPNAHGENLPSGPSTWHWQYTTDGITQLLPERLPGDAAK